MGNQNNQPLVSVVTPVYNGEAYLAECIESVLAQTYEHWEYVLVNNKSTDRSLAIARSYAVRDSRIRVCDNETFLDMIPNWNHAMQQISPHSVYCKVLHADDWLFPECLARMVALAEANPSVGIVSAYRVEENRVGLGGLSPKISVISGKEAGHLTLKRNPLHLFGSASSLLIRSEIIRNNSPFYDVDVLHADTEASLRTIQEWNLGFVHQVLTFTRRHNESVTSMSHRLDTHFHNRALFLRRYGATYLSPSEHQAQTKRMIKNYYNLMARALIQGKGQEYWAYHRKALEALDIPFSWRYLLRPLLRQWILLRWGREQKQQRPLQQADVEQVDIQPQAALADQTSSYD